MNDLFNNSDNDFVATSDIISTPFQYIKYLPSKTFLQISVSSISYQPTQIANFSWTFTPQPPINQIPYNLGREQ